MKATLVSVTITALEAVRDQRFYSTERGFQGRFYCALQELLTQQALLDGNVILEQEYQKTSAHGLTQRPDIIMYIPREYAGAAPSENNFAVWALKRCADIDRARDDFDKLDQMFEVLRYPVGFFININSSEHHRSAYRGRFPTRLACFSVQLTSTGPSATLQRSLTGQRSNTH